MTRSLKVKQSSSRYESTLQYYSVRTKSLEDIHDEIIALTLQLNISEEQNGKLRTENRDLVDRWMARKGKEADALNTASKFS